MGERGADWRADDVAEYYIRADASTEAGKVMLSQDWGKADSIPPKVEEKMCSL